MKTLAMMSLILISSIYLNTSSAANRESGGMRIAPGAFVKFSSFGTGIDQKTQKIAEAFINKALADGLVVKRINERQGKEGENLICTQFQNKETRDAFIKAITPSILEDRRATTVDRTSVRIGLGCANYDLAKEQYLSL